MHATEHSITSRKERIREGRKEDSNVGREEIKGKKLIRIEISNLNLNFRLSFDSVALYFICKKEA